MVSPDYFTSAALFEPHQMQQVIKQRVCCFWSKPIPRDKVSPHIDQYSICKKPVAPVAYQVILEPGIGQFREYEPCRVHTVTDTRYRPYIRNHIPHRIRTPVIILGVSDLPSIYHPGYMRLQHTTAISQCRFVVCGFDFWSWCLFVTLFWSYR